MQTIQTNLAAPYLNLLPKVVAPALTYHAYAAGSDADSEAFLELTHELGVYFDGAFAPEMLASTLYQVNPTILLLEVEETDGTLRTDWPWLTDRDLDIVEATCRLLVAIQRA